MSAHRRRLLLVLAGSFACGPEPAGTTASTSTGTTTGTTDAGHGVTGNPSTSTSTSTTDEFTTAAPTTSGPVTTGPVTSDTGEPATTGRPFITVPDAGGPGCPDAAAQTKQCDPWTQDCPPGQKCVPWSGGCDSLTGTKCTEVVPEPVGPGGACLVEDDPLSGVDNCDFGLLCAHIDPDTLVGTCVSQCEGAPDLPDCAHDPGTWCVELDPDEYLGGLCLPTCDPLAQACPEGQLCHPDPLDPARFVCLLDTSGSGGVAFDPCDGTACDPGLACVAPDFAVECDPGFGCCTPFCDTDAPACPGAGQVCVPYFTVPPIPPGLEDVGLCGLM